MAKYTPIVRELTEMLKVFHSSARVRRAYYIGLAVIVLALLPDLITAIKA